MNRKFLICMRKHLKDIGHVSDNPNKIYIWSISGDNTIKFRDYIYSYRGFCLKRKHGVFYTPIVLHAKFWRPNEEKYLVDNYQNMYHSEIAQKLNRTIQSIRHQSSRLKLSQK